MSMGHILRAELAALRAQKPVYVVFSGMPGPGNECVFIDVEDADGFSIGGFTWESHRKTDFVHLGPFYAAPVPAVPAGWQLVPVEPTIAGDGARVNVDDATRTPAIYRAMPTETRALVAQMRESLSGAVEWLESEGLDLGSVGEGFNQAIAAADQWLDAPPTNQCGETCERAKLCATCARGLEQPEQEPVAWLYRSITGLQKLHTEQGPMLKADMDAARDFPHAHSCIPLYAATHCTTQR